VLHKLNSAATLIQRTTTEARRTQTELTIPNFRFSAPHPPSSPWPLTSPDGPRLRQCAVAHFSSHPAGSFILPGTRLVMLGLTIESGYHPERDEGSDFFKSIRHKTNGRDVTGLGPLTGRRNVQTTCLTLRIVVDGGGTLAHAGHIPPYLNGSRCQWA